MRVRVLAAVAPLLGVGLIAVALSLSGRTDAQAGTPGVDCGGATCTIAVGNTWFCDPSFQGGVCSATIDAGKTITWDFSATGMYHSVRDCGGNCDNPTATPLFDSGILLGGTYQYPTPFDMSMTLRYRCEVHPDIMRGVIFVEGGVPTPPGGLAGDANCSGGIDAIDAALVLQFSAALVGSLPCQDNADANANGAINAVDATLILQYGAGLLDQLPP